MDENFLVCLLENVQTPDTAVVKQATTTLRNQFYKNPESLQVLVKVLSTHPEQGVRQAAAVAARSLVPKFWGFKNSSPSQLPLDVKAQIRESLLRSTVSEPSALVKHSSARVIAAIAHIDLPTGEWGDLPNFLTRAATSSITGDREFGVYTLFTLLETLQDILAEKWREFLQLFEHTIHDPESSSVRLYTMLALEKMSEFLTTDEYAGGVDSFKELVPAMVSVLKEVVEAGEDEKSDQAFEVFQTLLIVDHALIADHFRDLVQFFTELAVSKDVEDDCRVKALSFLLSCLRHKKMKMQALKCGEHLTLASMEIVTEMKVSDDLEDMTPSQSALGLLDFLSTSLPPSQVVVPLLNALPNYVTSTNENYRRAGILALGYCIEGSPDFFMSQLDTVFPIILQLLNDPAQAVRQAALHTTTQLADEMADELGKQHTRLVPLLINLLTIDNTPEMWKPACSAIDAVLVGVEQGDVEAYLPTLIPRLVEMFQHDDFKLKGAAVGALGSTACASKSGFFPYFQHTVNTLVPYATKKESEEELELRCAVMDCMGDVAGAVGGEVFLPYAQSLMDSAREGLNLGHTRLRETGFIFFSNIAKLYGSEFKAFLPWVVEALLDSLEQEELEFEAESGEWAITSIGASGSKKVHATGSIQAYMTESDDEDDGFEEDWQEPTVNAVAMEKEVAAEILGDILSHCGEEYLQYLQKTVQVVASKVDHTYEGIRKTCLSTLWRAYASLWNIAEAKGMDKWRPGLLTKVQPPQEVKELGRIVLPCTMAILKKDDDKGVISTTCQTLAETLKLCGPSILGDSSETVLTIQVEIVSIFKKKHPCQLDFDDDEGMPELDEAAEYDWLVVDSAMDVVLGLATALGSDMAGLWDINDGIYKYLNKYASSHQALERSTAVGVIADSIKHMGPAVTPHTEKLLKLVLRRLGDENAEVKSNAAYAMGVLCFNSQSPEIVAEYSNILSRLERLLQNPEGRMIDNAAGCLARMIIAHADNVPLAEVLPALVQVLPLREDYEENEPIYQMLVQLYHKHNQTVFEMTQSFVPIISAVLDPPEEQLTPDIRGQLVELVRFLASKDPSILQGHSNLMSLAQ